MQATQQQVPNPVKRECALRKYPGWVVREYADGTFDCAHTTKPAISMGYTTFQDAVTFARNGGEEQPGIVKAGDPEPEPALSLTAMAAQIEAGQTGEAAPPQHPGCTWCDDTGVVEWKDDGADEDGAPILIPKYCKSCPKGENHGLGPVPDFTVPELRALRAALSCTIGETDGTPTDHALYERIDAFLKGVS